MARWITIAISIVLLGIFSLPATTATINVPGDQPTIQAAIDVAVPGDTVIIADGTYTGAGNRNLDFGGKAITVRSANGPLHCVIDCEGITGVPRRAFRFHSGEGEDSIVSGITITDGSSGPDFADGGAIHCDQSSPTIIDSIFTDNVAGGAGGAIYCYYSSPTISGNSFYDNSAMFGGAIALSDDCSPLITDNVISGNQVTGEGGGIIVGVNNVAIITGNVISGNSAGQGGGAISCYYYSEPQINDNMLIGNSSCIGGAIVNTLASAVITNNLISGNQADHGGAIYSFASDELIRNNTIVGNSADEGGALYGGQLAAPTIENCILWNNMAAVGKEVYLQFSVDPSVLSVSYSDLEGGQSSIHLDPGCSLHWGAGMIDEDPLFVVGPGSEYCLSQLAAGQAVDSPCLDSGSGPADEACFEDNVGWTCLHQLSTRTDSIRDLGMVDMGYHAAAWSTVGAALTCTPASGTLPFSSLMSAILINHYPEMSRRIAARIDVDLAGGASFSSWRTGYANIAGGSWNETSWTQHLPHYAPLQGDNRFTLVAEDVTPQPYNQPPYPPAGSSRYERCTVTGNAP